MVEYFAAKGANDWNYAVHHAANNNHIHIVRYCIDKGASLNEAMLGAVQGGHFQLVKYCVSKGANDWNNALQLAVMLKGSIQLVEYLVDKGANNWKEAIGRAKAFRREHIVKFLRARMTSTP